MEKIRQILNSEDKVAIRALFSFDEKDSLEVVQFRFNLWARYCFPKYFTSPDAEFHKQIDSNNLQVYRGESTSFVNIAFRGSGKTARTKLMLAFAIANDINHSRKYIKVIAEDGTNSQQIVTDVYNMMVSSRVALLYPDVFEKTTAKREETMGSFTTATGIKVVSGIVGSDQRGALQEDSRPDVIWFEDFENRKTLRSARKTIAIWDNMEEARTSLAKNGGSIYTCNYISEQGNVHKLATLKANGHNIVIIPIEDKEHNPTWIRYSSQDIDNMRQLDDDFEGERLCKPSASKDIMFDRQTLDEMKERQPIRTSNGFRVYKEFNPSHRYAIGADIAGGVGLDSSASVIIDFDTMPAQVVATFANNQIKPEIFGDELNRQANMFGGCLIAPERNYGTEAILRLKQLEANLFSQQSKDTKISNTASTEYGWQTNSMTKPKMLFALGKAIDDGLISLNDPALIAECKAYTRNDLMETIKDPRLTTRHFDLLVACCISLQMKDYACVVISKDKEYNNVVDQYLDKLNGKETDGTWSNTHFDKYFPS